ncbi:hypothetical protein C8F01DRAFT_1379737 [Mycena amicta]|nr:hypothetical protein C8F01DRAFT_1379737 [Mycena amicta]
MDSQRHSETGSTGTPTSQTATPKLTSHRPCRRPLGVNAYIEMQQSRQQRALPPHVFHFTASALGPSSQAREEPFFVQSGYILRPEYPKAIKHRALGQNDDLKTICRGLRAALCSAETSMGMGSTRTGERVVAGGSPALQLDGNGNDKNLLRQPAHPSLQLRAGGKQLLDPDSSVSEMDGGPGQEAGRQGP